jgi:protein-disulfide isomerase
MLAGFALLQVSVASTGLLVLEALAGVALPGCGAGSPCARASASVWGKVPGLGWPVSIVGFAFFLGLLQAWWVAAQGNGVGLWLRQIIRAGAVVSAFFVVVSAVERLPCAYCLTAHGANLGLWLLVEAGVGRAPADGRRRAAAPLAWAGVGVAALVLLVVRWEMVKGEVLAAAEKQRAIDTRRIIDAGRDAGGAPSEPGRGPAAEPTAPARPVFTGRYRWGPERAVARIVIFSDYQCQDCKRIEAEVRQVMATRTDVSVSAKHFPFCTDCNRYAPNLHRNACWAARAAEAAGIVGGADAFWKMHQWLFDRAGVFNTNDELRPGAAAAGVDFDALVRAMTSEETLARVRADIDEAVSLGIFRTPMIFINGVEMKGWMAGQALGRTVEAVVASGIGPAGPEHDRPPTALEKAVADWRENPRMPLPSRARSFAQGPADAPVRVVLFADDQMALTAEAEAMARSALSRLPAGTAWRYEVRWFPFSRQCNPGVPANHPMDRPLACLAARAAEAAGTVGGADAFWKMHAWLLANRERLSEAAVREAAGSIGLDVESFARAMNDPSVHSAISGDLAAAAAAQVQGVPIFVVNERQVRLWRMDDGTPVLPRIFEEAAAGR